MNVITWLLEGNPNIAYLANMQLLGKQDEQVNDGYIKQYLDRYNPDSKMWGNGLYGPKWISSTYTLLDLINLYAAPEDRMIEGYYKLREEIVVNYTLNPNDNRTLDLCIVGMLIRIGSYLHTEESSLEELIDFVIHTLHSDGAWNCYFNYRAYQTSSVHTTLNVLEGLLEYKKKGYRYRISEVEKSMNSAQEFLLQKHLFRSRRTMEIIDLRFTEIHYPTRWFYDVFRALEYFTHAEVPYDKRMDEGLNLVRESLAKGPLKKGKTYTGKFHFKYDLEDYKRINTLRALTIVKQYDLTYYKRIIEHQSFKR